MQTFYFDPQAWQTQSFRFEPELDGETYFCAVTANQVAKRYYIEVQDQRYTLLGYFPVLASPDNHDIQLCSQLNFTTNFVFRASNSSFEVDGIKRIMPRQNRFIPLSLTAQTLIDSRQF